MIDEDFSFEAAGSCENSPRWQIAPGSSGGMVFSGSLGNMQATIGATNSGMAYSNWPSRANQSVEIAFNFDSIGGGQSVGVMCRVIDGGNFILATISQQGSKQLTVIEAIDGALIDVLTVNAPATGTTGGLKIEAIGRRLRAWYEVGGPVQDRPPDAGGNLRSDPTNVGAWGMTLNGSGTNNMAITAFRASMLPIAVMIPPQLRVEDVSGLRLTPVTLNASGIGTFRTIEWEVVPMDIADVPEAYRAQTTTGSYCVYVRGGYNYRARCRPMNGAPGPWTDWVTIAAIGSPDASKSLLTQSWATVIDAPGPGIVGKSLDTFPGVPPDYVLEVSDTAVPLIVTSPTGHTRVSASQPRPRRGFQLVYENRPYTDLQLVIDFFEFKRGRNEAFNWFHPTTGEAFQMRFATDDYKRTDEDYSPEKGSSVLKCTFTIVESVQNQIPVFPFRLMADPTL